MGGVCSGDPLPPLDSRVVKAMDFYKIKLSDIKYLYAKFRKHDTSLTGEMDLADFYKMIHTQRSVFGDSMFELVDTNLHGRLSFSDFLLAVVTFSFFERDEILKFIFFIFDRDKNGYIEQDELRMVIKVMHRIDPERQFQGNFKRALRILEPDFDIDGKVDFEEFRDFHRQFPSLFNPAFQIDRKSVV